MATTITIQVPRDEASQALGALAQEIQTDEVKKVMGRAVQQALKLWFFKLDAERPNALGGTRSHFYAGVARSVQAPQTTGDGVTVSINHLGIAQRRFGGTITPVQSNWLTIPARAEAYGKRAGAFPNLHFVFFRAGLAALVENAATKIKRVKGVFKSVGESGGGGVYFWLVKSVFQKADPSVLPGDEQITAPALQAAGNYLARVWERRVGT